MNINVGDLVTVWTGGWDVKTREKYEGKAGIVTGIGITPFSGSYSRYHVNFGWGDVEILESRLRPLINEEE
jgi:hypothetical protein